MKIKKSDLEDFKSRIESIFDDIDDFLNSVGLESAESEMGEALHLAQTGLDTAMDHIKDSIDN